MNEIKEFVTLCYRKYLGREPDDIGLMHYVSEIEVGKISRDNLPHILLESDEFKLKQAEYSDFWKPQSFEDAKRLIWSPDGSIPSTAEFIYSGLHNTDYLSSFVENDSEIIDYGCGVGRIAKFLSKKARLIHAIDISPEMLKIGREFCKDCPNINFLLTNGNKILLEDSSIDFAYSVLTLQHVEKEDAFLILKELNRVLKTSHKIYLTFPNMTYDAYWKHFENYALNPDSKPLNRTRLYTVPEVEMMMKKSGFRIIEIPSQVHDGNEDNIRIVAEKV